MPQAARHHELDAAPTVLPPVQSWSGDVHGPVGELHRAIEERMLAGADVVAVLPLQPRPGEALMRLASRVAGWGAVAACAAGGLLLLTR